MMIDTGAGPNLLKIGSITSNLTINEDERLRLTGINEHPLFTLGQVSINIFGIPTIFNLIPDDVPVEHDGVLGTKFFQNNNAKINYAKKQLEMNKQNYPFESQDYITIPGRSISDIYVHVTNKDKLIGYVSQLSVTDGIFLGKAIVSNNNGRTYLKIANTCSQSINLLIPKIKPQNFEEQEIIPDNLNNENETTSFDPIDQLIDTFFNTNNKEFDNNNNIREYLGLSELCCLFLFKIGLLYISHPNFGKLPHSIL